MIEYIPTTEQFIAVVNKRIDPPKLLNALGHMALGLAFQYRNEFERLRFRDFIDKDRSIHPTTSENGFIILHSENSNQLRTLRNRLIEDKIPFTDFTKTMVEGTYATQQNEFDQTVELDLEYFGVCFFMAKEKSREYTKKFSLYTKAE